MIDWLTGHGKLARFSNYFARFWFGSGASDPSTGYSVRMICLTENQTAAIRSHGEREFPYECCGVILGDLVSDLHDETRIVRELRPLENSQAEDRERRYLVSPEQMFALMHQERDTGLKILGFYHSHPDHPALPSVVDRELAFPWYVYIIVSVISGRAAKMTAWQLDEDRESFLSEQIEIG